MVDSILWQSEASDVTLIDIPRSIAAAQGTVQHPCHELLSSNEPLKVPFRSNEPKSATAKTKLCAGDVEQELQREYANICVEALAQVKAKWSGDWCLPRLSVATGKPAAKRKHDDERPKAHMNATRVSQPLELYKPLLQGPDDDAQSRVLTVTNHGITASATLVANLNERPIVLPAEQRDGRKTFDFILLDPPWPNRSVKRTHKTAGSTYNTAANLRDVEDLLLGMDLDMLMADECLIGVWITNKQAIRALILDEGGLFDSWGVQLVEEWIWVKTTVQGKPVMPIDGLWRKPYEVLLLGRNQKSNCSHNTNGSAEVDIRRRVLMGVPDLHSRKPCLKELVEPLLSSNDSYRALEVFARYLVAGWWSWGNECIKFNSGECWEEPEAQEQSTD
ncbi:hypothetical protein LTR91_006108 [Friedmanniomyces endolithicus]|uniref:MT-A70-domain-containing protein n=1 Tax=Friedmanniomyces endolithicus TaxID=329885 RepID=A0AAN6FMG8_9PEZI|nr:hypothetical protein LTS09_006063 [Friedmanniomyces endolithicus]KAK0277476.1 hypothetical protein LTR35_009878 [Friedmanniomyces endolithicus]KAK0283208.1 hypothetical protein LTS00_011812 [Friedmanniomyces endolithicus]KAK0311231.1 hypothetical protein LTR01_003226 [Friedmanniomyces endolithicus]KAK0320035.1 hypothetical protein LTR82_008970 [Friedmanniomyces endolithicus]